jgi:glycosyltransferase involved in cell wall biosynthesis
MKLSIITINLNNAEGLRKTIESVINQTFKDFEYIVIDGGSTDGSVEIIKEYADYINYWISEPDKGIYNAMNKGIAVAKGEYCFFLNSGDYLIEKNILIKALKNNSDIIAGYVSAEKGGRLINIFPPKYFTFRYLYYNNIPHQGEFIKRELFDKFGHYNDKYKILGDYEFNVRAMLSNATYEYINYSISMINLDGISNTENLDNLNKEKEMIIQSSIPKQILNDYKYFLDRKGIGHPAIQWLVDCKYLFKFVKLLHYLLEK